MSLQVFKAAVEQECGIARWHPSQEELREIATRMVREQPNTPEDANRIVNEVVPNTLRRLNEGVDNSDLKTLLILAMAAANSGAK